MADDRSNVTPFPPRAVRTRDGVCLKFENLPEGVALDTLDLPDLITEIESYGFACEAGELEQCAAWTELRRRLGADNPA